MKVGKFNYRDVLVYYEFDPDIRKYEDLVVTVTSRIDFLKDNGNYFPIGSRAGLPGEYEYEWGTEAERIRDQVEHHIWCNFFGAPREGCKMCEGLYEHYPMDKLSGDELLEKYFPEVIKV